MNGFIVTVDGGKRLSDEDFRLESGSAGEQSDGSAVRTEAYVSKDGLVEVESVTVTYPASAVVQRQIAVTNRSPERGIRVTRLDPFYGELRGSDYTLDYFTGTNGQEFEPKSVPLAGTKILECTAGRSSKGMHPWFTLRGAEGGILAGTVAWSGNWIFRFEPQDGFYRVSGGMSDWAFAKTLPPGARLESVPVFYVSLPEGGVDEVGVEFGRWGKRFWYPRNAISSGVPVTWNHWWPYEDSAINEDVFKANVDEAAALGIEICTLDAGWFGEGDPHCNDHLGWSETVDWVMKRGDWHKTNDVRFPSGIAALSDYVHAKGLKFGIWCEIEALGPKSDIYTQRPELPAYRDGKPLGYVCLGNPAAQDWAFGVLERLIVEYKADWIKLDFNLDPQAGCNRTDHGHEDGDGLYEHYRGYYALLERVKAKYPEVYLENCSSGGLRIDLGLARHTHGAFLSDPDFTRHHLTLFWGASLMLHPSSIFHFAWSQTIVPYEDHLEMDPIHPDLPRHKFDHIIRANMLNGFGVSYRLPKLPEWAKSRLRELIAFYKDTMRRFVGQANMHRLTGQTRRYGGGDSWNAYLYVMEGAAEAMLCAFRLAGGEAKRSFKLVGLDAGAVYEIRSVDSGRVWESGGKALIEEGLAFAGMAEESSEVLLLRKKEEDAR